MRTKGATDPATATGAISRIIQAQAPPDSSDASANFQNAASTGPTPNSMGFPAYQNAGRIRSQNAALQAPAMPVGPQRSATKNSSTPTAISLTPQPHHRPALPIERSIQPYV